MYDGKREGSEEEGLRLCEWCGKREAEEEGMVPGVGFLHLCRECALRLLSGIIDG